MILLLAGKANHCVCNVQTNQCDVKQRIEQFSAEKLTLIKNLVFTSPYGRTILYGNIVMSFRNSDQTKTCKLLNRMLQETRKILCNLFKWNFIKPHNYFNNS